MNEVISKRMSTKKDKIKQLDESTSYYEREISRIEIGIKANKAKMENKKEQLAEAMNFVKKQKIELIGI